MTRKRAAVALFSVVALIAHSSSKRKREYVHASNMRRRVNAAGRHGIGAAINQAITSKQSRQSILSLKTS
jgi:hypothetical protein